MNTEEIENKLLFLCNKNFKIQKIKEIINTLVYSSVIYLYFISNDNYKNLIVFCELFDKDYSIILSKSFYDIDTNTYHNILTSINTYTGNKDYLENYETTL